MHPSVSATSTTTPSSSPTLPDWVEKLKGLRSDANFYENYTQVTATWKKWSEERENTDNFSTVIKEVKTRVEKIEQWKQKSYTPSSSRKNGVALALKMAREKAAFRKQVLADGGVARDPSPKEVQFKGDVAKVAKHDKGAGVVEKGIPPEIQSVLANMRNKLRPEFPNLIAQFDKSSKKLIEALTSGDDAADRLKFKGAAIVMQEMVAPLNDEMTKEEKKQEDKLTERMNEKYANEGKRDLDRLARTLMEKLNIAEGNTLDGITAHLRKQMFVPSTFGSSFSITFQAIEDVINRIATKKSHKITPEKAEDAENTKAREVAIKELATALSTAMNFTVDKQKTDLITDLQNIVEIAVDSSTMLTSITDLFKKYSKYMTRDPGESAASDEEPEYDAGDETGDGAGDETGDGAGDGF
eukprot:gene20879-25039_t